MSKLYRRRESSISSIPLHSATLKLDGRNNLREIGYDMYKQHFNIVGRGGNMQVKHLILGLIILIIWSYLNF